MRGSDADPPEKTLERAQSRALLLLEHRERSRHEMEDRLCRAGFETEVVQQVMERLDRLGYLDDLRFAENYSRAKQRAGWGPVRIRHELRLKGVAPVTIDAVLEEDGEAGVAAGELSQADSALIELLRRRFGEAAVTDPRGTRRRAGAFLVRRGHRWQEVQRLLATAFDSVNVEDDAEPGET